MFELPENTKLSVIESIKLGLDSIEFDVRCTRDNIMCITHGTKESIEDGISEIENMTFEECK
jgi:glycerophosphoryl diester phosphodiesterase